jgi:hypothetical protein
VLRRLKSKAFTWPCSRHRWWSIFHSCLQEHNISGSRSGSSVRTDRSTSTHMCWQGGLCGSPTVQQLAVSKLCSSDSGSMSPSMVGSRQHRSNAGDIHKFNRAASRHPLSVGC